MTRKEFIKICGILGLTLPFQSIFSKGSSRISSQEVIIIGAGAAGMTAAYLLNQMGISFKILEAKPTYGGRMKKLEDFTDFPLSLGAEWLSTNTNIFEEIINNPKVKIDIETTRYNPLESSLTWKKRKLRSGIIGFFNDKKFVNSSWLTFFEQYILPSISAYTHFNTIVKTIDYTSEKIKITTDTTEYNCDKVIVTIPVKMMQNRSLDFLPPLPKEQQKAFDTVMVWDGLKAFIEFSEKFYPAFTEFKIRPKKSGQIAYYDASYGQNTDKHILGLFAVGEASSPYLTKNKEELTRYILNELDQMFEQKASSNFIKITVQNWTNEAFIEGTYVYDYEDYRKVEKLGAPLANKVFFAGEAYTNGNNWGFVHTATQSAQAAVLRMFT